MATQPAMFEEDPDGEAMPDEELTSILGAHASQAIGYQAGGSDDVTAQQEQALNYYNRVMADVPAAEGTSSVVDGTVALVVDNALAAVLKPFVSSDETVRFAPRSEEDIDFAEQATEYVNYIFNCDNHGFLILHDWFKDGLLTKLGVVKVWWEDNQRLDKQEVMPQDDMQAAYLRQSPEYLGEENGVFYIGRMVYDGRVKICNVPPEEFRISPLARSIKDAPYCAHVPNNVTRSDLIEMGFDAEIVENLPASANEENSTLRDARYSDQSFDQNMQLSAHRSQDIMALRDEYIRVDYDGDGVAELRRVMRVGDTILLNEETEENAFAGVCPIPMPHKVYGLALADLTVQEQRISTVLWRQMLDNLYKSNNPRPVVGEAAMRTDGATGETLADAAPGAAVMVRDINQLRYDAVPYTAGASMPMLEMVAMRVEETTGVSRAGQGLDSNSLKKSGMTATEMAMVQGGKNARIEMIARIFAETGVKRLFLLVLGLVTKHQQQERVIRLRNKWVPMDPRGWPEMDVSISVGLGVGDKSEQMALADGVLETMEQLAQSPFGGLVDETKVYNAVKRKLTAAGIKDTDEYLNEPQEGQQQEQKPDPEMMKVQAEMQLQQARLQGDQQAQAAKLAATREEAMLKQQLAREQAEFEAELAVERMNREHALELQRMDREAELEERRMTMEASRAVYAEQRRDRESDAKLSQNREGGSLAE
jgi:hypothetical protein